MTTSKTLKNYLFLSLIFSASIFPKVAITADYGSVAAKPVLGTVSAPPLMLMTMQRDGRLFYEAYDNASDINGDGVMDTKYNPSLQQYINGTAQVDSSGRPIILDYYGYFDSHKCYEYRSDYTYKYTTITTGKNGKTTTTTTTSNPVATFIPIGDTDAGTKKCASYTKSSNLSGPWSGDFLNYITTSRIDALRKVLYGGTRYVDLAYNSTNGLAANGSATTILERAIIPQDTHAYGKEYTSTAVDGYDIADYTPLSQPSAGKRHLFANVTLGTIPNSIPTQSTDYPPLLRVAKDNAYRVWDWLNAETSALASDTINGTNANPTDFKVRVLVCDSSQLPSQGDDSSFGYCKGYGNGTDVSYKPIGLLHKYGEKDSIYFGLLTGSFKKNFSGGVLRRAISSFKSEITSSSGVFVESYHNDNASIKGIAFTIDRLAPGGFKPGGWPAFSEAGEAVVSSANSAAVVGNPIAEMMYEGLRYFAGLAPTSAFWDGSSLDTYSLTSESARLPAILSWTDPYATGQYNKCSKPTQMVISDVTPTFDSDQLPGSPWAGTFAGTLGSLNVETLGKTIWDAENLGTKNIIIGEKYGSLTEAGMPTAKSNVSSFSGIRGLTPLDPMWQGSYYAASVAKFGKETKINAINSTSNSDRTVNTAAIALSSVAPQVTIPFTNSSGTTTTVTVTPYALTYNSGWKFAELIKLYVDNVKNVSGAQSDPTVNAGNPYYKFHVVFSDSSLYYTKDQDNDMDARATYEVYLDKPNGKVVVNVCSDPDPTAPIDQAVKCNLDGNYGLGYSATGVTVMHLGYTITGVSLPNGSQARLVVRNAASSSGDVRNTLDDVNALLSSNYTDNYQTASNTQQYKVASDGQTLGLNYGSSFTINSSASAGEFVPHDPLWYATKYGGYWETYPAQWAKSDGVTPRSYFKVNNPAELRSQLDAALKQESDQSSSGSAAAVNGLKTTTVTAVYQATYESKYWSGHLYAFPLTNAVVGSTATWDAATVLPAYGSRNIFTYRHANSGPTGIDFKWSGGLNTAEKTYLSSTEAYLNFIRGDRTNEGTGSYRTRAGATVLGDIVNSGPTYVGTDNLGYASVLTGDEASKYTAFMTTKSTRSPMVYAGANDGMLHGFLASTGVEQFAYIPRAHLLGENASRLSDLVLNTYSHAFYVDGPTVAGDFYNGSAWKSALVGTLGAGGRAIYALDITDPTNFTASSVLWEFAHPELGYVRNPPIIARLNDGNWYVLVGNGFESDTCDNTQTDRYVATSKSAPLPTCTNKLESRNAKLFIIKLAPDLSDGWTLGNDYFILHATDVQSATTTPSVTTGGTYSNGTDNGLSGPATINNSKTSVSYVYAGDLQGNVWKFDLSNADPTQWNVAYKLFQATDSTGVTQPITTSVIVGSNPTDTTGTGTCVSAGTGRFVYQGDLDYKGVQSFYGLMDTGSTTAISRANDLQQYSITSRVTETYTDSSGASTTWNLTYVSNASFDSTKKGWLIDLKEPTSPYAIGERVIYNPSQYKTRANELGVTFTSIVPTTDSCDTDAKSYTYDFNACNGQGLSTPPYDLNNDGAFNSSDYGASTTTGSRVGGYGGSGGTTGTTTPSCSSEEICIPSGSLTTGCTYDLQVMSCTNHCATPPTFTKIVKKPPTATSCGMTRTSWRQLR